MVLLLRFGTQCQKEENDRSGLFLPLRINYLNLFVSIAHGEITSEGMFVKLPQK